MEHSEYFPIGVLLPLHNITVALDKAHHWAPLDPEILSQSQRVSRIRGRSLVSPPPREQFFHPASFLSSLIPRLAFPGWLQPQPAVLSSSLFPLLPPAGLCPSLPLSSSSPRADLTALSSQRALCSHLAGGMPASLLSAFWNPVLFLCSLVRRWLLTVPVALLLGPTLTPHVCAGRWNPRESGTEGITTSPASGSWVRSGASHRDGDPEGRKIHCGAWRVCWRHSGDITNPELALEATHSPTEAGKPRTKPNLPGLTQSREKKKKSHATKIVS